jgi:protein giant
VIFVTEKKQLKMNSYKNAYHHRHQSDETVVLDLSKRRDSVETEERKTPTSPYDVSNFSENSSPSTQNSCSLKDSAKLHQEQQSPANGYYYDYHHHHHQQSQPQHQSPPQSVGYALYSGYPPVPSPLTTKRESLSPNTEEKNYARMPSDSNTPVSSYAMQAAAFKQQLFQIAQPVVAAKDSDDVASESGSEGALTITQSHSQPPMLNITTTGYPMVVGRDGKLSRPFKAYPKDPLSLAASFSATDAIMDTQSAEKYNLFRKRMIEQIHAANGGQMTISNPKMRRMASKILTPPHSDEMEYPSKSPNHNNNNNNKLSSMELPTRDRHSKMELQPKISSSFTSSANDSDSNPASNNSVKDSAYYERRKKNNAAAKKSRDRRRIKEDEISIRAAFLERENIELKFELAAMRKQLAMYGGMTTSL